MVNPLVSMNPSLEQRKSYDYRNPAVFAEQGYVVIAPNPTGSTSYGQEFTDAIRNSWGGLPYEDISSGIEYIKDNLPYVDTERAVALGASYGGYMIVGNMHLVYILYIAAANSSFYAIELDTGA